MMVHHNRPTDFGIPEVFFGDISDAERQHHFGDQTVSINTWLKAMELQFQKMRQHHPRL